MPSESAIHHGITSTSAAPRIARAAYQGEPGAFGEEAVQRFWGGRVHPSPAATFDAVLDALAGGAVEWAVLPVWNSSIGPVVAARDALQAHSTGVTRAGEVEVPVRHCLLALPGATWSDIRHVGSHPAALAQCRRMFQLHPGLTPVEALDTAGAARQLASYGESQDEGDPRWYDALAVDSSKALAVIASGRAAEVYGLEMLQRGVNDEPTNFTRFMVLRAAKRLR